MPGEASFLLPGVVGSAVSCPDAAESLMEPIDDELSVSMLQEIIDWCGKDPIIGQMACTSHVYLCGHSRVSPAPCQNPCHLKRAMLVHAISRQCLTWHGAMHRTGRALGHPGLLARWQPRLWKELWMTCARLQCIADRRIVEAGWLRAGCQSECPRSRPGPQGVRAVPD